MPDTKHLAPYQFKKGETGEAKREAGRLGAYGKSKSIQRKKDIKRAMEALLEMPATGKTKALLNELGYDADDQNNAAAIVATLYSKALMGDSKALELILDYSFKVAEDIRKTRESEARISAMATKGVDITVESGDGSDGGVVIYLPEGEKEDEEPGENMEGDKCDS